MGVQHQQLLYQLRGQFLFYGSAPECTFLGAQPGSIFLLEALVFGSGWFHGSWSLWWLSHFRDRLRWSEFALIGGGHLKSG